MSTTTVNLGFVPKNRGEYSSTATYYKDNIVQYNGSSYICNPSDYDPDTNPLAHITGVAPYASDPAVPNTGWAVFCNDASGVGEGVYDVSVDHTTDSQPKKYANLSAALQDVPQAKQKGGMTIRFIQSSDNNYVKFFCTADEFTTDVTQWQGVYDELVPNKNLTDGFGIAKYIYSQNETQVFVYKHIYSDGSIADNSKKNVVFNNLVKAKKGSFFYVDSDYKYQYALYDIETQEFIQKSAWNDSSVVTTLDNDYFIRLEISNAEEIALSDMSIIEHLHYKLFNDVQKVGDLAQTNLKQIIPLYSDESNIIATQFGYQGIKGVISGDSWNTSAIAYYYIIPAIPNCRLKITQGNSNSQINFLRSYTDPSNGDAVDFASEHGSYLYANTVSYVDVPSDAKYMYLLVEVDGGSRIPTSISVVGLTDTIHELEGYKLSKVNSEQPRFAFLHLDSSGGAANNGQKEVAFIYKVMARKGSSFYADSGYKYQYSLYNPTTGAFVQRVTWINGPTVTTLDSDYLIRIEIANSSETQLSDMTIVSHLHYSLYDFYGYTNDCAEVNAEDIKALQSDIYSKQLDLGASPNFIGFIYGSAWSTASSSNFSLLNVSNTKKVKIKANSSQGSPYSFLKSFDYVKNGENPDYATGYTGAITVPAGTEVVVDVPEDAVYMYVATKIYSSTRTPQHVIIVGDIEEAKIQAIEESKNYIDEEVGHLCDDVMEDYFQLSCQGDNLITCIGESEFKGKVLTLIRPYRYTCWPIIGKLGDMLVCLFSEGEQHEATTGKVLSTLSGNGLIWTPKRLVVDDTSKRDNVTGCGNDSEGNLLFWNRVGLTDSSTHYDLYKTTDGYHFDRISQPTFDTIVQPMDIFTVPTKGLISFFHTYGDARDWGYLLSADDGLTWTRVNIETSLSVDQCPVEISGVYLGDGKILALGRYDSNSGTPMLWQLQSDDYGETWTRVATNISGAGNTPALIYDGEKVYLYLYKRQDGKLYYSECVVADVWGNPTNWPSGTVIATGHAGQDAGNVKAIQFGNRQMAVWYDGIPTATGIYGIIE